MTRRLLETLLLSCALSALAEEADTFRCDNGKQIPRAFVGDDFCDCGSAAWSKRLAGSA